MPSYQQAGLDWMNFLRVYQLHGILCDDMGLGKTLQSICILASEHAERKEAYAKSQNPSMHIGYIACKFMLGFIEDQHLPSLVICPSTLQNHWFAARI